MDGIVKVFAALGVACLAGLAIWQLSASDPVLPHFASGLLLLGIGVVAGLRIGYESARAFMDDAVRTNRVIVDMNRSLSELNGWLMNLIIRQETGSDDSTRTAQGRDETLE